MHCISDRVDVLCGVMSNLAVEFFLEGHNEFDRVKTVRAEIINEVGALYDLIRLHTKVFDNYLANPFRISVKSDRTATWDRWF